ncbi:hypothetical protein [Maribacter arcticus]|uniref:DUF4142 domain-containing protein n=1 Tax=Maribacter arcticus TaxID=561365 RepID=A0A1T4ZWR8_9FLAO|nr:hypothetical protein [Maribacter arcticus]SKB26803.1 hypothetical protein SAMN05660866_00384 [Maribacter arcticus]
MKKATYIFCTLAVLALSSFRTNLDCEYANSNMGFAKSQITAALLTDDINQARFYAYKAVNALEKSKNQLKVCGCTFAKASMNENLDTLVLATKSTTLEGTRTYLDKSIELINNTMFVLDSHDSHNSTYANDVLSMNTNTASKTVINTKNSKSLSLNDKIDLSLAKYKVSLEKVVATINCKDAKAFAQRIFDECENQLLKPNLTEGSKYYNLRTKEITQNALNKIGDCPKEK